MPIIEREETVSSFDTRLELLQHFGDVHTPQRGKITSDFVYARLDDKDKEGTIEMTHNAEHCRRVINAMSARATKWEWDARLQGWTCRRLTKKELEHIDGRQGDIYDSFMTRVYMTAILNRNVKNNHLLRLLVGDPETEPEDGHHGTDSRLKEAWEGLKSRVGENRTRQREAQ